jgi:hypothetical protein
VEAEEAAEETADTLAVAEDMVTSRMTGTAVVAHISSVLPARAQVVTLPSGAAMTRPMAAHGRTTSNGIPRHRGKETKNCDKGGDTMKKLTYVKPKVVGTANVHPC